MTATLLIPLALQVGLPLALIAWLAFGRHGSRLAWMLAAVAATAAVGVAALAGLWLVVPWWLALVEGVLLALALVRSWRRVRGRAPWPRGAGETAVAVVNGVAALCLVGLVVTALAGRRAPPDAVQLAFPLRGGTYLVVNGGSTALVNAHLATLGDEPRFRPWRGQSHGVDLVRVNAAGLRATRMLPADPGEYAIFGDTVRAPCTGTVVRAVDGIPDQPVPHPDRANLAGNHVLIDCGPHWVLLAHLWRFSVRVRAGDEVSVHEPIGRVGNSGNSQEPHLHVHAQRPGTAEAPLGGDPLPVRFDGRYLVRNMRIRTGS